MTGLLLESATSAVKLGVQEGQTRIIIQKATEDKRLVPVGAWEQGEEGTWISKEWGAVTMSEMVDRVEALCRKLLSV